MVWPAMADFQEAIQNPGLCFSDPELQQGLPVLNKLGLPKPVTGSFASVYQVDCGGRIYAVRCFLRYQQDQEMRYALIDKHLSNIRIPYMVGFEFQKKGILVGGQWYPVLKMEWVDGEPFNSYIAKNLKNSQVIKSLAQRFWDLAIALRKGSIGHGDLQHGNMLIVNGRIRLIDYDGMFVPGMENMASLELGHQNYQHPARNERHFGDYLDNFSSWVIYTSLIALSFDQNLWTRLGLGDNEECLLFQREDFLRPDLSVIFSLLEQNSNDKVRFLAQLLKSIIYKKDLTEILPLEKWPEIKLQKHEVLKYSSLPGWLADQVAVESEEGRNDDRPAVCRDNACDKGRWRSLAYLLRYFKVKQLRHEINLTEKKIKKLIDKKNKIIREIEIMTDENDKKLRECDEQELSELRQVKLYIETDLDEINQKRQKIRQDKEKELRQALEELQSRLKMEILAQFDLAEAAIPAIGPELKNRLCDQGIRTAADFIDVNIENTAIIGITGRRFYIEGMGPMKASRLLKWRQSVESLININPTLPADIEEAIIVKHQAGVININIEEKQKKKQAQLIEGSIRDKYLEQRRELMQKLNIYQALQDKHLEEIIEKLAYYNKKLSEQKLALSTFKTEPTAVRPTLNWLLKRN
jgi:hypothetical protein